MTTRKEDLHHLERVRNLCRAALALGLAASLAANIVAAEPTVVGRVVAGWPPLVLMIVVELIGRVTLDRGWMSWIRLGAAGGIAAVAALVSYKHMLEVATIAGEPTLEAHLIPLTVDGLVVVASISLVGLNQRIRAAAPKPTRAPNSSTSSEPSHRRPATNGAAKPATVAALPATTGSRTDVGTARAARAVELADAGWSQQRIADELGVSVRTIRRDLKEPAA